MGADYQAVYRSSPQQLTTLLELDDSAWPQPSIGDLRSILTHQLDAPLLLCHPGDELAKPVRGPGSGGAAASGAADPQGQTSREDDWLARSIRQVLEDPSPSVSVLSMIKNFAKRHIGGDGNNQGASGKAKDRGLLPREVALVLYYLAIATAQHQKSPISSLDRSTIRQGLTWCSHQPWLDAGAHRLIQRALSWCEAA